MRKNRFCLQLQMEAGEMVKRCIPDERSLFILRHRPLLGQPALVNRACALGDIHFHSPTEELSGTICRFMSYPRTFGVIADWVRCETTSFPNDGRPFCHPSHLNVHFNTLADEMITIVRNPFTGWQYLAKKVKMSLCFPFSCDLSHSSEELGSSAKLYMCFRCQPLDRCFFLIQQGNI